ncbi:MAG: DUF1501 domain-containing protein [Planctomycetes bacterium]|nr:DUF1501 domain-containing protein [Planctomycetota bacterium]MCB9889653.1 DUF1501 domain-containing protein [Planctomycetota bacterium]
MKQPPEALDRREFLRNSALAAGALALPPQDKDQPHGKQKGGVRWKTKRVVLVAFAGGVRSKEVLESPANVPNLTKIAGAGCVFPNVRAANLGHYGAALSLFTGVAEPMGIRDDQRGSSPTIFEYLRKHCGFRNNDIWLSTANGAQGRLFAHSSHPQYGKTFAANVLDGDGIFNKEFKDVLESFGRPKADDPATRKAMDRLAAALDPEQLGAVEGTRPDPAHIRAVERFILEELQGSNTRITGPGAGDAKAIRVAHNLLRVFKPKLLGITLQNADIAHGSYNGYVEVIRRNDAELGKLWQAIQSDRELRETTTVMICPEFGRDANLNQRNGLDHGDGSDSLRRVFMICAGPDFKKNKVISKEIQTVDLCPTVLSLFTRQKATHSNARVIRDAFV